MKTVTTTLLIALVAGGALAQPGPFTPAPVPALDSGHVAPADRAGVSNSSANQAPFAGAPNNMIPDTGQPTPQTIGTPGDRNSAGAPAITK